MKIIKYESEEEKQQIINDQAEKGYILTAISNISDGNYLGFTKDGTVIPEPTSVESKIDQLQMDNTILLMSIVDLYTEIQTLKGGA